jgi:spore coat polysaccharide biosynthesis protein SpsF
MNSTRLQNKVVMSLAGKPLLIRLVERVKSSVLSGTVVVATTKLSEDDIIVDLCKKENILFTRGHPTNLLDRHLKTGLLYNADVIVKIPSDCPLIDPSVITKVIQHFLLNQDKYDYVSNLHPASYPDGNDVEVFTMEALKVAWLDAKKDYELEHTTPFFWENPNIFRIGNVFWEAGLDYSMSHRWTIDYLEDYTFIKTVFDELYLTNPNFGLYDILNLLEEKPYIKLLNNKYAGVNWYRKHLTELKTIKAWQTRII